MTKSLLEEKLIWPAESKEKYNNFLSEAAVTTPKLYNILTELALEVLSDRKLYVIKITPVNPEKQDQEIDFDNRQINLDEFEDAHSTVIYLISRLCMVRIKENKNMTSLDYFKDGYTPKQLLNLYIEENITGFIQFSELFYKYLSENKAEIEHILLKTDNATPHLTNKTIGLFYQNMLEGFKYLTEKSSYASYPEEFSNFYRQHYQNLYDTYAKNQVAESEKEIEQFVNNADFVEEKKYDECQTAYSGESSQLEHFADIH